jgi:hypothetical protein
MDFPYRTGIDRVKRPRQAGVFGGAEIAAIEPGDALKLLPRLAAWRWIRRPARIGSAGANS